MRILRILNILLIPALALASFTAIRPLSARAQLGGNAPQFVPGEVVIGFEPGLSAPVYSAQASALAADSSAQLAKQYGNLALLSFADGTDVPALADQLGNHPGVRFAEPNYIYSIPEATLDRQDHTGQTTYVMRRADQTTNVGQDHVVISTAALQAMRTKQGTKIKATYPNDPGLWANNGWSAVNAPIVWPNTTASAGVCVLDTGVDYLHPDLSGRVVNGYDFVNGDVDAMDDYGHGTHVAGIIAAKMNNGAGIAGVSTGKVVAVKVIGGSGWGTNFDIASGMHYCAARTDVRILNMSLGGPYSKAIEDEVNFTTNTQHKIIVAAAGNDNRSSYCGYWNDNGTPNDPSDDFWVSQGDERSYPAGFATAAHNYDPNDCTVDLGTQRHPAYPGVLSVAASGVWRSQTINNVLQKWVDYGCKAAYSNYGTWVNVVGPGTSIYSTTPYDKPFYANYSLGWSARYEWLDGTSMATPFVAASAARRWGYHPLDSNTTIAYDTANYSNWQMFDSGSGSCWPASMVDKFQVDVAALLDRGAFSGSIFDASNGIPLAGAQMQVFQGTTLRGTGIVGFDSPTADVINLAAGSNYLAKVSKSGYTAVPQVAFQDHPTDRVWPGLYSYAGRASIPAKSTNFDVTLGWWWYANWGEVNQPTTSDLDLDLWLPEAPNLLDPSQTGSFIVGSEGSTFGYVPLEGDTSGAMTGFPFARWKRDGGFDDKLNFEIISIASRKAHGTLAANVALPQYPGDYAVMVTDWGQTIDHDGNAGTPEIPLMGAYFQPYVYIWKDGVIKYFDIMGDPTDPYGPCNTHWWRPVTIHSGKSGAVSFTADDLCNDDPAAIAPYMPPP